MCHNPNKLNSFACEKFNNCKLWFFLIWSKILPKYYFTWLASLIKGYGLPSFISEGRKEKFKKIKIKKYYWSPRPVEFLLYKAWHPKAKGCWNAELLFISTVHCKSESVHYYYNHLNLEADLKLAKCLSMMGMCIPGTWTIHMWCAVIFNNEVWASEKLKYWW